MSKHTDWPLHIHKADENCNEATICHTHPHFKIGKALITNHVGRGEANANAVLWASAPQLKANHDELVEALKGILRLINGEDGPKIIGEYDEDARYNYPERQKLIRGILEPVLSKIDGEPQTLLENRSWVVVPKEETP